LILRYVKLRAGDPSYERALGCWKHKRFHQVDTVTVFGVCEIRVRLAKLGPSTGGKFSPPQGIPLHISGNPRERPRIEIGDPGSPRKPNKKGDRHVHQKRFDRRLGGVVRPV
jgi:hypothetical protein